LSTDREGAGAILPATRGILFTAGALIGIKAISRPMTGCQSQPNDAAADNTSRRMKCPSHLLGRKLQDRERPRLMGSCHSPVIGSPMSEPDL
jgi:hypothetical protein